MYRYNLIDFFPLNNNLYFIFLNSKKLYEFPIQLKDDYFSNSIFERINIFNAIIRISSFVYVHYLRLHLQNFPKLNFDKNRK